MQKLQNLDLKISIKNDSQMFYLKWLVNNFNYIYKLRLHLKVAKLNRAHCENISKLFIDANFIRRYCLPDTIPNLIQLKFYICSQCQLPLNNIEQVKTSFQTHSFFVNRRWTNVKCLFDEITSCQHIFSCFTNRIQISNNFTYDHSHLIFCSNQIFVSVITSMHLIFKVETIRISIHHFIFSWRNLTSRIRQFLISMSIWVKHLLG